MAAVAATLLSMALVAVTPFLEYEGRITFTVALIVAPVALVLSCIAVAARARCEIPRPKLPIFALLLSAVSFALLAGLTLFGWGLGKMH
jgi:hypothetical protein